MLAPWSSPASCESAVPPVRSVPKNAESTYSTQSISSLCRPTRHCTNIIHLTSELDNCRTTQLLTSCNFNIIEASIRNPIGPNKSHHTSITISSIQIHKQHYSTKSQRTSNQTILVRLFCTASIMQNICNCAESIRIITY